MSGAPEHRGPALLTELRVRNLGVIADAHLDLGPGLTVITGETGAGKTLLVEALSLLRGERADPGRVGPLGDEAAVEARFESTGETVLVRRVSREGRSRAAIDGNLATAGALRERVEEMLEIHGQHASLALARPGALRGLVDRYAGATIAPLIDAYAAVWRTRRELGSRLDSLGDARERARELDLLAHQVRELEAAGLTEADDHLDVRATRLRRATELRAALEDVAAKTGDDAYDAVAAASARARAAADIDPDLAALADRLDGLLAELADVAADARAAVADADVDPTELAAVEDRLAALSRLRHRYGDTIADMLAYLEAALARAADLAALEEGVVELRARCDALDVEVEAAGTRLRIARTEAAALLAADIAARLHRLALADARLEVTVAAAPPGPDGADTVTAAFAAQGETRPLTQVASGGELSRILLATLAACRGAGAVAVFDEVDAGIGGAAALAVGAELAAVAASGGQVLCVTHLAQVAAHADRHVVVRKEGGVARATTLLDREERAEELVRMMAGLPGSESGRAHAEELLAAAGHLPAQQASGEHLTEL